MEVSTNGLQTVAMEVQNLYDGRPVWTQQEMDELYGNPILAAKLNKFNKLLNSEPKKEWIQDHPYAKKKVIVDGVETEIAVKNIPIGIVEYLLTSIYIKWRVEIKCTKQIANSVEATIKLHVLDPITNQWDWQEGVGAAPLATKSGKSAADFENILYDAVQKASPAAESYAIKDAAEKFGKIFGKDLNRDIVADYKPLNKKFAPSGAIPEEIMAEIRLASTTDELAKIYSDNSEYHLSRDFFKIINARKVELSNVNSNYTAANA